MRKADINKNTHRATSYFVLDLLELEPVWVFYIVVLPNL